jgi:hypothetical protein
MHRQTELTRPLVVLTSIILLAGCATERESAVKDICNFGAAKGEYTVVAVINAQNARIQGDVNNKAELNLQKVATAVAVTKWNNIARRVPVQCVVGWMPTPFGPQPMMGMCPQEQRYDLGGVYGLARAPSMDEAESLALESCEQAAENFADSTGFSRSSPGLQCSVRQKTWC